MHDIFLLLLNEKGEQIRKMHTSMLDSEPRVRIPTLFETKVSNSEKKPDRPKNF